MPDVQGECRCGKVRLRAKAEPLITMACHCTGCQRMSASAFSLSSLFPTDAFEVVSGETVLGGLGGAARHFFCPDCLTWLFTRLEGMEDYVNVRSTMLANAPSYRPFLETWTRERLPWAATGAVHSFETIPEADRFPALIAEYAGQRHPPAASASHASIPSEPNHGKNDR